MKRFQLFALATLALGLAAPATLSAQDRRDVRRDYERQDYERQDYERQDRIRDDMARDQARLNYDIRSGRTEAAAGDARDLARDQRALAAQRRDIRRDRDDRYERGWR